MPDGREGRPRSVEIFTEPDSCWVSEAATLAIRSWALIFGRSGSPLLASAGTSPIVAAATPATATGTPYRTALRRPVRRFSASPASSASYVGRISGICSTSVVGGGLSRPALVHPRAIVARPPCGGASNPTKTAGKKRQPRGSIRVSLRYDGGPPPNSPHAPGGAPPAPDPLRVRRRLHPRAYERAYASATARTPTGKGHSPTPRPYRHGRTRLTHRSRRGRAPHPRTAGPSQGPSQGAGRTRADARTVSPPGAPPRRTAPQGPTWRSRPGGGPGTYGRPGRSGPCRGGPVRGRGGRGGGRVRARGGRRR